MLDGILIECHQKEKIQKSDKLPANTLIKLMKVIFIPLLFNKIEFKRLESPIWQRSREHWAWKFDQQKYNIGVKTENGHIWY